MIDIEKYNRYIIAYYNKNETIKTKDEDLKLYKIIESNSLDEVKMTLKMLFKDNGIHVVPQIYDTVDRKLIDIKGCDYISNSHAVN